LLKLSTRVIDVIGTFAFGGFAFGSSGGQASMVARIVGFVGELRRDRRGYSGSARNAPAVLPPPAAGSKDAPMQSQR
jgi:hypothetical protein